MQHIQAGHKPVGVEVLHLPQTPEPAGASLEYPRELRMAGATHGLHHGSAKYNIGNKGLIVT